jgi:uncharacterized protein
MNDVFSLDGNTAEFSVNFTEPTELGGYVEIELDDGERLLAQVVGHRADDTGPDRRIVGTAAILARIEPDGPARHRRQVFSSGRLLPAAPETIKSHLDAVWQRDVALELGYINTSDGPLPARLRARGFARHTFMCGQSGSGKTYTLGVILEQLLVQTTLRMVVLDPNSDYVHLGQVDHDTPHGNDALASGLAALRPKVHIFGTGHDHEMKSVFSRLTLDQRATVLRLDPTRDADAFGAFLAISTEFGVTDYGVADLAHAAAQRGDPASLRLERQITNLRIQDSAIWVDGTGPAIREVLPDDWRAVVFDLGSLAARRDRSIMAASTVTYLWESRHERQPVLLVVDEAHNVCPSHPTDEDQAMTTELLVAMAGEGRKYGIYLLMATQRPQKLHENVLSQCDNLLLMRMNSTQDIAHLSDVFSHIPADLVAQARGFSQGEGLAGGPITSEPLLFNTGRRLTPEGGSDVPATWATVSS